MADKIKLYNVEGIARKSGIDGDGNKWIEYELDVQTVSVCDDCEEGKTIPIECGCYLDECCECGTSIESGWLCLDGGDTACVDCVEVTNRHIENLGQAETTD